MYLCMCPYHIACIFSPDSCHLCTVGGKGLSKAGSGCRSSTLEVDSMIRYGGINTLLKVSCTSLLVSTICIVALTSEALFHCFRKRQECFKTCKKHGFPQHSILSQRRCFHVFPNISQILYRYKDFTQPKINAYIHYKLSKALVVETIFVWTFH